MRNRYYEWIEDQFSLWNPDNEDYLALQEIDLKQTGLLEFMVLEKSGYLGALCGSPIKTWFFPGDSSSNRENMKENFVSQHPTILLGHLPPQGPSFSKNHLPPANSLLIEIYKELQTIFPFTIQDNPKPPILKNEAFIPHCAFYITDKTLETCIKSSSPYIAAGELNNLSLLRLITLQQGLNLYRLYDRKMDKIADCLIHKLHIFMQEKYTMSAIQTCSAIVEYKFLAQQRKAAYELHFKITFHALLNEVTMLSGKSNRYILIRALGGPDSVMSIESKQYDPAFEPIGLACAYLETALIRIKKELIQQKLPLSAFVLIAKTCKQKLEDIKTNFEGFTVEWTNLNDKVGVLGTLLDEIQLNHQKIETCNNEFRQKPNNFFQPEDVSLDMRHQPAVTGMNCVIS